MSCNAECRCRKGIIALVFVPGIMGTRLKNNDETGKSVWDPAAGLFFTFKGEPSSTQAEMREWQKAELLAAQPDDDDGILESTGKFIHRGLIQAREFNPFYQVAFGTAEVARKTRTFFSSFSTLSDLFFAGPLERKALLVNSETEEDGDPIINGNDDLLDVDEGTDDYFRVFTSVPRSQMELKRKRGWGEVLWDNYGPLLKYLEDQESSLRKDYPGIRFPVFAVGYNWMLSNEVSGQRLNLKLAEFKKALLDEDKEGDNFGYTQGDIKFVIITHSMGGFVARSSFLSALNKDIAGVIHGAMPTHGSPSTYYQFRSGAVGHGLKGQAIRQVLGKNAADMTAVMGYCQGGLELLPNQLYVDSQNRSEWLFLQSAENGPRQSIGNAYGNKVYDFYRNFTPWYRLNC